MKSQIPYLLIHTVYNIKKKNPYHIYISCFFICRQWKTGNNSNEIQMLTPFKKLQFEFDHLESKMWNSIY